MMRDRLAKPWFLYRPGWVAQRLLSALRPPAAGYRLLETSWGAFIVADASKDIGRAIRNTGIYELGVSEAIARLVDDGDTVIDAGANVGYMTVLASLAVGPRGHVLSFEPHPELFCVLQHNVDRLGVSRACPRNTLRNAALGARTGRARLFIPPSFESNDGISHLAEVGDERQASVVVSVDTIDSALNGRTATLLKLDVEGWEFDVLQGAQRALARGAIRHIVFEDHDIDHSGVVPALESFGYTVLSLSWAMRGPILSGRLEAPARPRYEPPNFIASMDPNDAIRRCSARGWRVLNRHFGHRQTGDARHCT